MSYLNLRTEFSFRQVYGHIEKVVEKAKGFGQGFAGICDIGNTFGHIQWQKHCRNAGINPVFGATIAVVEDIDLRHRRFPYNEMSFIVTQQAGLEELYKLIDTAHQQFYYMPRLSVEQVNDISPNIVILSGPAPHMDLLDHPRLYLSLSPSTPRAIRDIKSIASVACCDNWYVDAGQVGIYEPLTNDLYRNSKTSPMHILTYDEWLAEYPGREDAIELMIKIGKGANIKMASAPMVKYIPSQGDKDIAGICKEGAKRLGLNIKKGKYGKRYKRELKLIKKKGYVDYFLVVADVVQYAKKRMAVGPSRGSSAGSLVCYLMGITEVDPIKYGLIFERFIDVNRADLPDIDIDFQDNKRHLVFSYLQRKYGKDCVAQIGNISRLKPKSAITTFAKSLCVPTMNAEEFKDAIMERSSGDSRSSFCIEDTFKETDIGKKFIKDYPSMSKVAKIEGHASHTGVHAAGILVCNEPITNYVGVNSRDNKRIGMLDKKDAEAINLLKIDALGLRTLTIIAEICDQLGKPYSWMYEIPLDDKKAYQIFQDQRLDGIFQFEGRAVRLLVRQMPIKSIEDVSAMGALCRPGPLHCGGATAFIDRRTGKQQVTYLDDHKSIVDVTKGTYGVIVYQEQVMVIGRDYGGLSWEDVSSLRKAMSKSLGDEFFDQYKKKFLKGAVDKGRDPEVAEAVWDNMCTFGSWSFNLSHAVSYGMLTYITAYLKAHHPLEFTVASLNNSRTDAMSVRLLREMQRYDGIKYKAIDKEYSQAKWSVRDGVLLGGLTCIDGIGPAHAAKILASRSSWKKLTPGLQKKLDHGTNPFTYLYPARELYGDFYEFRAERIEGYPISKVSQIASISGHGNVAFIGCLIKRSLLDVNEVGAVANRGGVHLDPPTSYINLMFEDDTDSIFATIWRHDYERWGQEIAETGRVGKDWYFVVGQVDKKWRKISVKYIKRITR